MSLMSTLRSLDFYPQTALAERAGYHLLGGTPISYTEWVSLPSEMRSDIVALGLPRTPRQVAAAARSARIESVLKPLAGAVGMGILGGLAGSIASRRSPAPDLAPQGPISATEETDWAAEMAASRDRATLLAGPATVAGAGTFAGGVAAPAAGVVAPTESWLSTVWGVVQDLAPIFGGALAGGGGVVQAGGDVFAGMFGLGQAAISGMFGLGQTYLSQPVAGVPGVAPAGAPAGGFFGDATMLYLLR